MNAKQEKTTLQNAGPDEYNDILEQATRVLGSAASAYRWMQEPAYGLGRRVPATVDIDEVRGCLTRMEHGIYI